MSALMTIKELCERYRAGEKFKYLFFWGHKENSSQVITKACFSQWYPSPFIVDNIHYASAEHFMMAGKARLFKDDETLQKIIKAKKPSAAKAFGRKVRGFDKEVWNAHCSQIVIEGNLAKFSQHPALAKFLLETGNKILVEASPVDRIWGIGLAQDEANIENPLTWQGQNLLGFALMVVREQLINL